MDIFEKDTQEFLLGAGHPVLLVGEHGVGKTSVLRSIAGNFGLQMHELNAATLDPFIHIVGIPVTHEGKVVMEVPDALASAELLFIDEVNRSDRQTRNALMEIICDKSVNGRKLPNLKLIVAAMNPPDADYHVDELDKALDDRFLFRFDVKRDISYALDRVSDEKHQKAIKKWYNALSEPPSPRRLTWVIESTFDGEKINEAALLNALDDKLYGTKSLISMLTSPASLDKLDEDTLLSENERHVISEIIYSGIHAGNAQPGVDLAPAVKLIRDKYLDSEGKTFLPLPTGELPSDARTIMGITEVEEINNLFNFPFNLKVPDISMLSQADWLRAFLVNL